jgi:hypothetical protein
MTLASLGAFVAMSATALLNSRSKRDFAEEWNENLRIKSAMPLDEKARRKGRRVKTRRGTSGAA